MQRRGNRGEALRRAESHVSPSQRCLRSEQGVRVVLVGPDRPSRPWIRQAPAGRRRPCHPSVQANRPGPSPPDHLWAQETPGVRVGPSHPCRLVDLAGRARPSRLWAPPAPGGLERPLALLGLVARAGAADRPTAWPACSLGFRARPAAPTPQACAERLAWRHAPFWLDVSVLLAWPFSRVTFLP